MYLDGITEGISNIRVGDNPPFTVENFLEVYPQFGINTETNTHNVPEMVINMYLEMAHARIKKNRWHSMWLIAIGLFTAHWCALYLQSTAVPESGEESIINNSHVKGLVSSMSADGVSVGYSNESLIEQTNDANSFNSTIYGVQFLTMSKLVGKGGFLVL